MKTLIEAEEPLLEDYIGPDPLLMKKRGLPIQGPRNIKAYKKKDQGRNVHGSCDQPDRNGAHAFPGPLILK